MYFTIVNMSTYVQHCYCACLNVNTVYCNVILNKVVSKTHYRVGAKMFLNTNCTCIVINGRSNIYGVKGKLIKCPARRGCVTLMNGQLCDEVFKFQTYPKSLIHAIINFIS